ncbi:MAG: methylated-DNA--[protein]-cysteine S-methyltransferase [Chlorobium sp.]|nr:MAG: methylated-DNA--[protein]-cysteine S-methyltransferase [Chlorobium sp.]
MKLHIQTTLIGTVGIAEHNECITNLYFEQDSLPVGVEQGETALLHEAFRQLNWYLEGDLRTFSLPLASAGTPFMQAVWQFLATIPCGTTASYRDVAVSIGNPRAVRAVGMANHRNPLPIFIPCHRVIGSNGKLTGYRGGLVLKKMLLDLEREV